MRRNTIGMIWLSGATLAAALYAAGPDGLVAAIARAFDWAGETMDAALRAMSAATFDAMRAAAISLYLVFLVLAVLAARRGLRARWAIAAVSLLVLALVGGGGAGTAARWFATLVLAGTGAISMSVRLLRAPMGSR